MSDHQKVKNNLFLRFSEHIYSAYIPNKRDNLKQILLKILFILCLIVLLVSAYFIADYFMEADKQEKIVVSSQELWQEYEKENLPESEKQEIKQEIEQTLTESNDDYRGWIKIGGTKINNPIYQTDNNDFYLNYNQEKKKSVYGALYFDCTNKISKSETDKNLVIYGHEMKNGSMFGQLKKYKDLNFYKKQPTIDFSTIYDAGVYKVYAVFVLNAEKTDDNGYIYNIYRQRFSGEKDFEVWINEAKERSVISTNVDVKYGDNIITLVTCSEDFENSRLVVMARKTREDEEKSVDTSSSSVNPNPRYPQKWYDERGFENKFLNN